MQRYQVSFPSALTAGAALILSLLAPQHVQAAPAAPSQRWVIADDVRLRAHPGPDGRISATFLRGAELSLDDTPPIDGFCPVRSEAQWGYVACTYLSAKPVARARSGVDGVDPAQRWVSGTGLTLRDAPTPAAAVLARLSLNAVVKLVREDGASGYCEVQPATGAAGFTACRYLARTPVILANVRGDRGSEKGALSADYDPERMFWLQPGWNALEQYADYLKKRHVDIPQQGPYPRNEALERMKAHLALGIQGRKPEPFADWSALKRKAAQYAEMNAETLRMQEPGKTGVPALQMRMYQLQDSAATLSSTIGIWGALHDEIDKKGESRTVGLLRALEFAEARPSLFRTEAQLAPPTATAEQASGRFGIVFRQLVAARPKPAPGPEGDYAPGLYDMLSRTDALVRPVHRVQLSRDGRLRAEASVIRKTETLWRYADGPECWGWSPGFAFGDADPGPWRYFAGVAAAHKTMNANPPGSLFAFYTTIDLPPGVAARREATVTLDRARTGFVRGTHLYYDLDSDGIADLAVWEGEGKGPGHLEGVTSTDDRWYRLVLVNINGAWKVLGSDMFSYGCGC